MSAMQDRFYEDVASRFGLKRGSNSGGRREARPSGRRSTGEKGIRARIRYRRTQTHRPRRGPVLAASAAAADGVRRRRDRGGWPWALVVRRCRESGPQSAAPALAPVRQHVFPSASPPRLVAVAAHRWLSRLQCRALSADPGARVGRQFAAHIRRPG